MTIDQELVTRKMVLIARDLEQLRGMLPSDEAAFVESLRDQAVVERYLERMIGRAIDINFHLITESGEAPPPDYHTSFVRLGALGILEPEFARRIAAAAGLRNRLVHVYDEIDPKKIYRALESALEDIPKYLEQIDAFLESL